MNACLLCGQPVRLRWWDRIPPAPPPVHWRAKDLDQCWRAFCVRRGVDPTTPMPLR